MNTKGKIAGAGVGAVMLLGIVGVGVSYADDPTDPPTTAAPTSAPSRQANPREHAKRGLFKRALHGEVTVGGKRTRVIDFQRGTVQKISATSITVKSTDDYTKTYVVTSRTRVRQADQPAELSAIETGDKVRVVAFKEGGTSTAKVVREPKR